MRPHRAELRTGNLPPRRPISSKDIVSAYMRSDRCGECGDEFVWDIEAGSAVCPSCGTLQDSSQLVLDSHIEPEDTAKERDTFSFYRRSTLKGFRNANGWDLAGQGSQATAERNKIAMREFTTALVHRIGHPSLSSRTLFLFELAMERARYRYGRRARLVAGASLAIALRESQKGETVKDIAYVLNESHVVLARVFTTLLSLLGIKLAGVDPSWHLLALQKHLTGLLVETPPNLPRDLVKALKVVNLPCVLRTATSLSEVVSRAGLLVDQPSPPTACAVYILALEAEVLNALPQCGELARVLGRRFGVGMEVVMRRYRRISEHIERCTTRIPWMEDSKSRSVSKVAKRVGLAKRLKDVIQFQEGLWKARREAAWPIILTSDNTEPVSSSEINSINKVDLHGNNVNEVASPKSLRPRKRQKTGHIDDVSCFLLSPLRAGSSVKPHIDRIPSSNAASHLLTSESPSFRRRPTRLELLAATKSVDEITDEELFAEGELDSFLRNAEEREALVRTCDWARTNDDNDQSDIAEAHVTHFRKDKRKHGPGSRVNIEALHRLFDEYGPDNGVETIRGDDGDDDSWALIGISEQAMTQADRFEASSGETSSEVREDSESAASVVGDDDEEVLGPWKPFSPTDG